MPARSARPVSPAKYAAWIRHPVLMGSALSEVFPGRNARRRSPARLAPPAPMGSANFSTSMSPLVSPAIRPIAARLMPIATTGSVNLRRGSAKSAHRTRPAAPAIAMRSARNSNRPATPVGPVRSASARSARTANVLPSAIVSDLASLPGLSLTSLKKSTGSQINSGVPCSYHPS